VHISRLASLGHLRRGHIVSPRAYAYLSTVLPIHLHHHGFVSQECFRVTDVAVASSLGRRMGGRRVSESSSKALGEWWKSVAWSAALCVQSRLRVLGHNLIYLIDAVCNADQNWTRSTVVNFRSPKSLEWGACAPLEDDEDGNLASCHLSLVNADGPRGRLDYRRKVPATRTLPEF
jgi:hypothetical protein